MTCLKPLFWVGGESRELSLTEEQSSGPHSLCGVRNVGPGLSPQAPDTSKYNYSPRELVSNVDPGTCPRPSYSVKMCECVHVRKPHRESSNQQELTVSHRTQRTHHEQT